MIEVVSTRACLFALALALAPSPSRGAPAAAPAVTGFPQHDPAREHTLLGSVRASDTPVVGKAKSNGEFTDDGGRLMPVFATPPAEQLWFPDDPAAHLGDGLVRARVENVGKLDLSVLVRQRYVGDPPGTPSGYGASVEGDRLRLHRWDRGMALPMGSEASLSTTKLALAKRKRLELVVLMIGPQLVASVYDGDTLEHIATTTAHDTTYAFGCVGVRVGPRHTSTAAVTLLTTMDASKHASREHMPARGRRYGVQPPSDVTPFGNTRYAWIDAAEVRRLPAPLRASITSTLETTAGRRAILFLDTVGYERLRRSQVEVLAIDSNIPWSAEHPEFRARASRAPSRRGRGFVLDDSYKDPALVEQLLRAYHERYPAITELVEIGRTHQRRPIWALRISDTADDADEPAVLLDGAHHGSELLSIEYVLDAIDQLLAGYGHDARVTTWVDGLQIWCVPLVNVDGTFMFVHESRFAIRKNAFDGDRDGFADPFEGVDLNRNYPFGWGELGSSEAPMHKWYRGPAPGSEPETLAMMGLAERERFAAVLSFHTYGTDVYSSYVVPSKRDHQPDVARAIGKALAAATPVQPNDRAYAVREGPYPVAGSDQDWYLHAFGTMAYVVEGSHHNPPLDVRTAAVEATRPLWQTLLDRVRGPWIGGHVRDSGGKAVDAEVRLAEHHTFEGERWTTRARDGRFDRAVDKPGTYTLQVLVPDRAPIERVVKVGNRRVDVDIVVP